jgi:hypothetical protein
MRRACDASRELGTGSRLNRPLPFARSYRTSRDGGDRHSWTALRSPQVPELERRQGLKRYLRRTITKRYSSLLVVGDSRSSWQQPTWSVAQTHRRPSSQRRSGACIFCSAGCQAHIAARRAPLGRTQMNDGDDVDELLNCVDQGCFDIAMGHDGLQYVAPEGPRFWCVLFGS